MAINASHYCSQHQRTKEFGLRPSSSARGYDRKWAELRRLTLARQPFCYECAEPATEVDHIVPLRFGGRNAADNLQPLCKRHHSIKTACIDKHRQTAEAYAAYKIRPIHPAAQELSKQTKPFP